MIQPRTQTRDYWEYDFSLSESDLGHIYNHFLEIEQPQSTEQIVRAIMRHRVAEEKNNLLRRIGDRAIYEPKSTFAVSDEIVFPAFDFSHATVLDKRDGQNPQAGDFKVIAVKLNGRRREFVSELQMEHDANLNEDGIDGLISTVDGDELYGYYGSLVESKVFDALTAKEEFLYLGGMWFVSALLADISIGHLHISEAILEMSGGGPLSTEEILVHLELDSSIDRATQIFSLNNALLNDKRFDEVAPKNHVAWFLNQLAPNSIRAVPERLAYTEYPYDTALLSPQLKQLEGELADEWSNLESADFLQAVTVNLIYPHRVLGTLPLNTAIRKLLPLGRSPRQMLTFADAENGEEIDVWVHKEGRYIFGLKEWFERNEILVGSFITLKKGAEATKLILDFDRRRPQREDVRLASVVDGRVRFELQRRRIHAGYDDLLVIGTDFTSAIDAVWKRVNSSQYSLSSLIAALLPELARLSPQNAIHSKTVYSAVNMLRRMPPGPVFAELVRHPAFLAVGDQYWRFDPKRWQRG